MYTTDRLILRSYQPSDAPFLHSLTNNPLVHPLQSRYPAAPTSLSTIITTTVLKLTTESYFHAIITPRPNDSTTPNSSEKPIGWVCLNNPPIPKNRDTMFAISLVPEEWGKGYGSEVTRFVIDWGFRMGGLHRISLGVFASNEKAIRVYEKVGFIREGLIRKENWVNGRWEDTVMMGILDEDWEKIQRDRSASLAK